MVRLVECHVRNSVGDGDAILHTNGIVSVDTGSEASVTYNLLLNVSVVCYVVLEACPEADGVGVHVEAGLDEGHGRCLDIELVPSREWVCNALDTESLQN